MPRSTTKNTDDRQQQQHQHKVSVLALGKPSLRLRLEAYYAVMAPDQIADITAWRTRYDQIWEKFGGTEAGELKLATKLAKKYGTAIRLQLTTTTTDAAAESSNANSGHVKPATAASAPRQQQHNEAWFELNEKERSSGNLCFTSTSFDPAATLLATPQAVVSANECMMDKSMLLDRVQQFRPYLPRSDPQFQEMKNRKRPKSNNSDDDEEESNKNKQKIKPLSSFAAIASHHETGPLSVLHKAFVQRDRIRVLIRYVNGIRGTLTGTLIAFDKHFNLILRDVDEVYSRRQHTNKDNHNADDNDVDNNSNSSWLSNAEIEVQRRIQGLASFHYSNRHFKNRDSGDCDNNNQHSAAPSVATWSCRQRSMRQIMVRGDNVVSVHRADMEQSAWPVTSKSPKVTMYRKQSIQKNLHTVPREERIGTPGSLIYAAATAKRKRQQQQRHQQQQQQRQTNMGPPTVLAAGRKYDYRS